MTTALILLFLFVLLTAGIFASFRSARRSGAPFFPTPASAIENAFRVAGLSANEIVYDLGTGTGKVLLIAAQEFGARATGYEISPFIYCIAKINLLFRTHAKPRLVLGNFFDADLRDADVIFCFLAIRTMPRLEEKLKRELKKGARIISYAFPLPGLTPERTIPVRGAWKMFVYRV